MIYIVRFCEGQGIAMKKVIFKIILIFIPILLILGAVLGYYIWYNMPINKIERAFEEGNIKEVVSLYSELTNDEDMKSVQIRLKDMASDYYDGYLDDEISYDEVVEYLELVTKKVLKKDKDTKSYIENIAIIKASRDSFDIGLNLMNEGSYLEAIVSFGKVSDLEKRKYKEAKSFIEECTTLYCEGVVDRANELIASEEYEDALSLVQEALSHFEDSELLSDKLEEILTYLDVDLAGKYTVTYDLGDMIVGELGMTGYDVYFPATIIFELGDDKLAIYVDSNSIESALNALTADSESMKAVYALAEDYGIGSKEADMLIAFTYGGSYTKFILDNFGGEIEDALAEFSHEVKCSIDNKKIYIGTTDKNDNSYLTYTDGGSYIIIESYTGNDAILGGLTYPLKLVKSF